MSKIRLIRAEKIVIKPALATIVSEAIIWWAASPQTINLWSTSMAKSCSMGRKVLLILETKGTMSLTTSHYHWKSICLYKTMMMMITGKTTGINSNRAKAKAGTQSKAEVVMCFCQLSYMSLSSSQHRQTTKIAAKWPILSNRSKRSFVSNL